MSKRYFEFIILFLMVSALFANPPTGLKGKVKSVHPQGSNLAINPQGILNQWQNFLARRPGYIAQSSPGSSHGPAFQSGAPFAQIPSFPPQSLRAMAQISNHNPISSQTQFERIVRDSSDQTIVFLSLKPLPAALGKPGLKPSIQEQAEAFLDREKELLRLRDPINELRLKEDREDSDGSRHLVFERYQQGIPIWANELILHFDSRGNLYACNGRYAPSLDLENPSSVPITQSQAQLIAETDLGIQNSMNNSDQWPGGDREKPAPTLCWWQNPSSRHYFLVWFLQPSKGLLEQWNYFIDARSGEILAKYNQTRRDGPTSGYGTDLLNQSRALNVYQYQGAYYLLNASKPMWQTQQSDLLNDPKGGLLVLDARNVDADQAVIYHVTSLNNTWSDAASVSIGYFTSLVYDYYYQTHGRNSIDNQGMSMVSVIHLTENGESMANAFWNGSLLVFGDGGDYFHPLARGLDVVAHEITHGVVQHTVGLEYQFQSGALDEAFADWGGAMCDREDWYVGEDVVKPAYFPNGIPMRDMSNPHNQSATGSANWLPAHMSEFQTMALEDDNGGVHINVGIINKATYLIGEALGKNKLEQIYYRVLSARYLSRLSQFIDMRLACLQAAGDLFGAQSAEVSSVGQAFDQVGITGSEPTEPDPDLPPIVGDEWVAMCLFNGVDNMFAAVRPVIINPETDIRLLSRSGVSLETGSSITIPDDGSVLFFIDTLHRLMVVNSDGTEETIIDDSPIWSSIAISPDAQQLVATTIYATPVIHYFDLENSLYREIQLYVPTTSHSSYNSSPLYADALDFNLTGDLLIYDTYNAQALGTGDTLWYWDLQVMDLASQTIFQVFPPQGEGINLGNPTFSQTSPYVFAFDYFMEDYNQTGLSANFVFGYDLFSGEIGQILGEYANMAFYPNYSVDDQQMVFQKYNDTNYRFDLYKIALKENKIEANGAAVFWVYPAIWPKWFAIGNRPSAIKDAPPAGRDHLVLSNYPNPFNRTTEIRYELPSSGDVEIRFFDVLGQCVDVRRFARQVAGIHRLDWPGSWSDNRRAGSGVYFCRVLWRAESGESSESVHKLLLLD